MLGLQLETEMARFKFSHILEEKKESTEAYKTEINLHHHNVRIVYLSWAIKNKNLQNVFTK
jgi:hypothetical protein